jgi:SAM-dependent methyltransferase
MKIPALSFTRWIVLRFLLLIRGFQFTCESLSSQAIYRFLGRFDDRHIRLAEKLFLDELKRSRLSMKSMRKFRKLRDRRELQVELGSGADSIRPGWVNIDMSLSNGNENPATSTEDSIYIDYDLRLGLPLPDGSCKFIYSSHFFEHLEYPDAVNLLKDCHRCLQNDGRLRLALPNYRPFLTAYIHGDYDHFRVLNRYQFGVPAGEETLTDFLSLGVYENGEHKYIYDPEKCIKLLSKIGFRNVSETAFLEGIDLEARRQYTFYVEAIK